MTPDLHAIVTSYGVLIATILLFFATVWYGWATARMAAVMRAELRLRTTPSLGFGVVKVQVAGWSEMTLCQTVVNTGEGFVTLHSASLAWWPHLGQTGAKMTMTTTSLPLHLGPRTSGEVSFSVPPEELSQIHAASRFDDAAQAIDARITYEFGGPLGDRVSKDFSWTHRLSSGLALAIPVATVEPPRTDSGSSGA